MDGNPKSRERSGGNDSQRRGPDAQPQGPPGEADRHPPVLKSRLGLGPGPV